MKKTQVYKDCTIINNDTSTSNDNSDILNDNSDILNDDTSTSNDNNYMDNNPSNDNNYIDNNYSDNNYSDNTMSSNSLYTEKLNKCCKTTSNSTTPQDNTHIPFILRNNIIRYNIEQGVKLKTNVLFGSKTTSANNGNGFRATHLLYNATIGSLAFGRNINNQWSKMGRFSLITGYNNMTTNESSFISGINNKIINTNFNQYQNDDDNIDNLSSCAIIGDNNTMTDSKSCAIIASSNVNINNGMNTVVLGMNKTSLDTIPLNLKETTITRNLFSIGKLFAGPILSSFITDDVLIVNGSAGINTDLNVKNNITCDNLNSNNITIHSKFLNTTTSGISETILPTDNTNIIYCNPSTGDINIYLGNTGAYEFQDSRSITIKDVSIVNHNKNIFNIYIWTDNHINIETYDNYGLVYYPNRGYIINTAGGCVTFTYFETNKCWVITNQFIGNIRHKLISTTYKKYGLYCE
jgi:hypothetical protein